MRRPFEDRRHKQRKHVAGFVGAIALFLLVAPVWSLAEAYRAPGNDSIAARTAEWMRDHYLGSQLDVIERWNLRLHPPKVGGVPKVHIAAAPSEQPTASQSVAAQPSPPNSTNSGCQIQALGGIRPVASPPLAQEGCYQELTARNGHAAMKVAYVRPDSIHTSYLTAVVWMSNADLAFALHPGVAEPGQRGWALPSSVDRNSPSNIVAAFNSAFRLQDSQGGYFADGRLVAPLVNGGATAVIDQNGKLAIGTWGRDFGTTNRLAAARQNLVPIVDNGVVAANINDTSAKAWGKTVGNASYVWRSGVGQTRSGDIVEVIGPSLTAQSLARILVNAGAVRAMELDINKDWTSFMTFQRVGRTLTATNILPDMFRGANRYFTTSSRDFVTATLR